MMLHSRSTDLRKHLHDKSAVHAGAAKGRFIRIADQHSTRTPPLDLAAFEGADGCIPVRGCLGGSWMQASFGAV